MPVLIVLSLAAALAAVAFTSQATLGAVVIGGACYLAILARIAQSHEQHKKLLGKMEKAQ
jgi:threonine/homoserine/homoserine lactone efflux protein